MIDLEIGDFVYLEDLSDKEIAIISSKKKVNDEYIYGCRHIKVDLIFNKFILTPEYFEGLREGIVKKLTIDETFEYIKSMVKDNYEDEIKEINTSFKWLNDSIHHLISCLSKAKFVNVDTLLIDRRDIVNNLRVSEDFINK